MRDSCCNFIAEIAISIVAPEFGFERASSRNAGLLAVATAAYLLPSLDDDAWSHVVIASPNPRAAVRVIIAAAMAFFIVGCASSRDVSNDPRYQIGFIPGQVYRLTRPATLYAQNTDAASYLLDIDAWASQHLAACGTLPDGARLRISRLVHETVVAPIQGESYVTVYATLLDPPWRGHSVRIGWGLCRSAVFTAADGWPTVVGSPDPAKLAIEPETRNQ